VGVEEAAEAIEAEDLVDGGIAVAGGELAEEIFDGGGGLVGVEDAAGGGAGGGPHMRRVAGDEEGFAGAESELSFAEAAFEVAVEDVDPFVLVKVEVFRASGAAGEFKEGQGALGVFGGGGVRCRRR
jgi:hypothetical protein